MQIRSAKCLYCLIVLSLLISGTTTNATQDSPPAAIPKLPQPSGPFGVGRIAFDWIDANRPGDMAEDRGAHTELMVYLWYPTEGTSRDVKSLLFPGAKEIDSSPDFSPFLKAKVFGGNWPLVISGAITSHVQANAPISKNPKAFPVVLFSPGAFGTCFQYSSAIEDLVSHGYIIAAVEHTSEVFGVLFLDGKLHMYSEKRIPKQSTPPPGAAREEYQNYLDAWNQHNVDVRAADLSFVLNKLIELNNAQGGTSQFARRLDLAHVAAVGHSRGGWSSIVACRRDERFKACVNEDGNAGGHGLTYPGAAIPKQPILYVEISPVLKPGTTQDDWIVLKQLHLTAEQWVQQWHQSVNKEFLSFPSGGYFVQLTAPGMEHYSFSDEVVLRAGKDETKDKQELALHNLRVTEDLTRAFLDEIFKNEKQTQFHDTSEMTVKHFDSRN